MDNDMKGNIGCGVCCVVALGVSAGFYYMGHHDGYESGQQDYRNGIIKYEMTEQPNGEVRWKESGDE